MGTCGSNETGNNLGGVDPCLKQGTKQFFDWACHHFIIVDILFPVLHHMQLRYIEIMQKVL